VRSSAVNPRIQCVRQGPGSRPSFMINPNGSALEPADGRIYPERAGLPAPVHRPRAPKVTISRRIRLSADPPPTPTPRRINADEWPSHHKKQPVDMFLMR